MRTFCATAMLYFQACDSTSDKGEKADLGFSDFSRFFEIFEIFSDFSGFQRTIILGENDVFFTQIFRP